MSSIFIDAAKFLAWLWGKLTKKQGKKSALDETQRKARLVLQKTFSSMDARAICFYRLIKLVRSGQAEEDTKQNGLLLIDMVEAFETAPPPTKALPIPLDMGDLFDMHHLAETIFDDFWEWPDRLEMDQRSLFCDYMKDHGTMACLCYHLKNAQGSVVAMMAALYSDPHKFTDGDRDTMRLAGRQLQMIFPWLGNNNGGK